MKQRRKEREMRTYVPNNKEKGKKDDKVTITSSGIREKRRRRRYCGHERYVTVGRKWVKGGEKELGGKTLVAQG